MAWFQICDPVTGAPISLGDDWSLGAGVHTVQGRSVEAVDVGASRPDLEALEWSPASRAFVARPMTPARDRIAEFNADAEIVSMRASLTGAERNRLDAKLAEFFGAVRERP